MAVHADKFTDNVLDDDDASKTQSNPRGRPRIYPETETATERVNRSVANLVARGGARRTFRLSPAANNALQMLRTEMGKSNDTAVIEQVLIKAAKALEKALKTSGKK